MIRFGTATRRIFHGKPGSADDLIGSWSEMDLEDQNEVPVVEGDRDEEVESAEVREDRFQRLSRIIDRAEAEIWRVD